MTLTTFAFTIGILELLVGFPFLFASSATTKFLLKLLRNDVFMRTFGLVIVIISALVLRDGAAIGTDASGLIRLVAWISLIKGLSFVWFPSFLVGISEGIFKKAELSPLFGLVAVVFGILLLYAATIV